MFWTTKEKTPEELLKEKYLELIRTNGFLIVWDYQDTISWEIRWVDVTFISKYEEKKWWDGSIIETITTTIGKIQESDTEFARKIWYFAYNQNERDREIKKKEQIRKLELEKAEEQRKKDAEFMEEYKRLCWSSKEFSEHFKLLEKIENLWKSQIQLLNQWEKNQQEIYNTWKEFYSLKE